MQDFIDFLTSIPQSLIPWIGAAGLGLLFLGTKTQIAFIRTILIGAGVACFVFSFLWMLQWFDVYESVGGSLVG